MVSIVACLAHLYFEIRMEKNRRASKVRQVVQISLNLRAQSRWIGEDDVNKAGEVCLQSEGGTKNDDIRR